MHGHSQQQGLLLTSARQKDKESEVGNPVRTFDVSKIIKNNVGRCVRSFSCRQQDKLMSTKWKDGDVERQADISNMEGR